MRKNNWDSCEMIVGPRGIVSIKDALIRAAFALFDSPDSTLL